MQGARGRFNLYSPSSASQPEKIRGGGGPIGSTPLPEYLFWAGCRVAVSPSPDGSAMQVSVGIFRRRMRFRRRTAESTCDGGSRNSPHPRHAGCKQKSLSPCRRPVWYHGQNTRKNLRRSQWPLCGPEFSDGYCIGPNYLRPVYAALCVRFSAMMAETSNAVGNLPSPDPRPPKSHQPHHGQTAQIPRVNFSLGR
jgi:hypothetical protein